MGVRICLLWLFLFGRTPGQLSTSVRRMYSRATSLIQLLRRWSERTRCVRPFSSSCGTGILLTERTLFLISNLAAAPVVHCGLRWSLLFDCVRGADQSISFSHSPYKQGSASGRKPCIYQTRLTIQCSHYSVT